MTGPDYVLTAQKKCSAFYKGWVFCSVIVLKKNQPPSKLVEIIMEK